VKRNILFALYYDFTANSAIHVHNFANQLATSGHSVAVAVPKNKDTAANLGEQQYTAVEFRDVDGTWDKLFGDGRPPDVVHAWTPREIVRLFCEKIGGLCRYTLVIHLEDNEERILEVNLGLPFARLLKTRGIDVPVELSHPARHREFLASAAGVTIIMDRLAEFVPESTPRLILWPGADTERFRPLSRDSTYLAAIGVPANNTVICYTGNVHSTNKREVRSLYVAVAMLNREGVPTTLVRAGEDHCPFLGPDERWAHQHSIELGYVKHTDIPRVLNLADYLIQPGAADEFNDYRLPAKLPEFFALGRPVVLPRTNVGRFVGDGEEAIVLDKVDALAICDNVKRLNADLSLVGRLADGALQFAKQHFDWQKNGAALADFYERILHAHGA
jgi:glycosyltransferase involved in cell wall biosynthesis